MASHWVVVGNGAKAKIYASDMMLEDFDEVDALDHEETRRRGRELYTDDRGRTTGGATRGKPTPRSAINEDEKRKREEMRTFAGVLADRIARGFHDQAYDRLILVAPPTFLGELRKKLDKPVTEKVVAEAGKDLTQFSIHELPERVRKVIPDTAGLPEGEITS